MLCPIGVSVRLLGAGGRQAQGIYVRGGEDFWHGWDQVSN